MTIQPFHGRFFSGTLRTALVASAALAISIPNLWARLPSPTAAAVAITATLDSLITAAPANFATVAATDVDSLMDTDNDLADQTAILKAALGKISDTIGSSSLSEATLLDADEDIGAALAADPALEGMTKAGLTTVLEDGIVGVKGLRGTAQTVIADAAGAFVEGLVSVTVPNDASLPTFAVDILKKVSANTSVDEQVAYEIGLQDGSTANVVTLATTLFKKYPAAEVQVTEGLTEATPQETGEGARSTFIEDLTAAEDGKDAAKIAQGAVFADPFYAEEFTESVFTGILSAPKGAKLLVADAGTIAKDVGAVLGQDGTALTSVADDYSNAISMGELPATSAATYLRDLIIGASTSKVPTTDFFGATAGGGGGKLSLDITAATVADLESIYDLLITGIIAADESSLGTTAGLKKAEAQIKTLTADLISLVKNETFDDNGMTESVAGALVGSGINTIDTALAGDPTAAVALSGAATAGADSKTNATTRAQITTDSTTDLADFPEQGPAAPQETSATNM